ncbi:MAG: hypothetical protein HQL60_04745 [Magnetococcales bacterium]|nr:hypothetical protein [Magnetococcales bacterium]
MLTAATDELRIGPDRSLAIDLNWIASEAFSWPIDPLTGPRLRYRLFESILRDVAAEPTTNLANLARRLLFTKKALAIDIASRLLIRQLRSRITTDHAGIVADHASGVFPTQLDRQQRELFIDRSDRSSRYKRWLAFHGQALLLRQLDAVGIPRPLLRLNQQPLPNDLLSSWSHRVRNPYSFLGRRGHQRPPSDVEAAILTEANRFSHIVDQVAQQVGAEAALTVGEQQQIVDYLVPQLTSAWQDYQTIHHLLRKRAIDCFLGSLGGYFAALLAFVAKENGGHVYSSIHANFDFRFSNGVDMMETIGVDRFYCLTDAAAERAQRLAHRFWQQQWGKPPLTAAICSIQPHRWSPPLLTSQRPRQEPIRQVMVMGLIANPRNMQGPLALPVQLHWEWRLCRLLVASGYTVIYKAHPENSWLGHGQLLGPTVHIERRPFEQVWHQADAFVVLQAQSTTVQSIILRSDRPVCFLWHREIDPCDPLVVAEIEARCHIIPVWIDPQQRLAFDPPTLLAALQQPKPVSQELRQILSQ